MASTYVATGLALASAGTAADACQADSTPFWADEQRDQCAVAYYRPWGHVGASAATRLGETVVSQFLTQDVEPCVDGGEEFVAYYDCATGQGMYLGGAHVDATHKPLEIASGHSDRLLLGIITGPATRFVGNIEQDFAPDYAIDAMRKRAEGLDWVTEIKAMSGATVTLHGKRFNLACGCELPQTGGN